MLVPALLKVLQEGGYELGSEAAMLITSLISGVKVPPFILIPHDADLDTIRKFLPRAIGRLNKAVQKYPELHLGEIAEWLR